MTRPARSLAGEDDPPRLDVLDSLNGLRFLPVDRRLYLRVQFVLNSLQTSFPAVRHAVLLHADQLVFSGLTAGATQQIHRYVVSTLLPYAAAPTKRPPSLETSALPDEALAYVLALLQRQIRVPARSPPAGVYVCGAGDPMQDTRSAVRVPCVYLEHQRGGGFGADGSGAVQAAGAGGPPVTGGAISSMCVVSSDGGAGRAMALDWSSASAERSPTGAQCGVREAEGAGPSCQCGHRGSTSGSNECDRLRLIVFQLGATTLVMLAPEVEVIAWSTPMWCAPPRPPKHGAVAFAVSSLCATLLCAIPIPTPSQVCAGGVSPGPRTPAGITGSGRETHSHKIHR